MDYNVHYAQNSKIHLESITYSYVFLKYLFCSAIIPTQKIDIKYAMKLSIGGLPNANAVQLGDSFTLFLEGPGKYVLLFFVPNNCFGPVSFFEYWMYEALCWISVD